MDARIMYFRNFFAGRTGMAVAALALVAPMLAGCATQPSAPTIFGARIVPANVATTTGDVHVAAGNGSGLTIFGVPTVTAPKTTSGVALASMP
jgi:hypothetical protein